LKKPAVRTVRCILEREGRFLLVVHRAARGRKLRGWALPGGRVERGEEPEAAVRRELREELRIQLGELRLVGDYRYKGHKHRVFAAVCDEPLVKFPRAEILKLGWHAGAEIDAFEDAGDLHAGFEARAVRDLLAARR
jgi:8-oxo-dGTP pyrophosphatase MutT (NUDIX family)